MEKPGPITFSGHKGPVYAMAHAMEQGAFVSGSSDGMVVRWNVTDPEHGEVVVNVGQAIFSLCFPSRSGLLIIGTEGGGLHLVDLLTGEELQLFEVHRRGVFRIMELSGDRVASAGGDGTLSIWRFSPSSRRLELLRQIPLMEEKLRDLAVSPDGEHLAIACGDGTIRILDTKHFNELWTLQCPNDRPQDDKLIGIGSVAFHPVKPVLVSGGKDGRLRLWHTGERYRPLLALAAHKAGIYRIAFAPGTGIMATASRDKTAKTWDAVSLGVRARLDHKAGGHTHSVNSVMWMGNILLTCGDDRSIKAWPGQA